jgi:hypothetical protein
MRPFRKEDWYGFAGAEEAPDKPAMIGSTNKYIIVADINGIGIYTADCSITYGLQCDNYLLNTALAARFEDLQDNLNAELLERWGFIKY